MPPTFYNSLTKALQPFTPLHAPDVFMYNCGPTVYDFAHIGNFRAFCFADLLRRYLELLGYRVHQVMNITDVGHMTDDASADGGGEDKMQVAARRLKESKKAGTLPAGALDNPDDPYAVAAYYTAAFVEDARRLRLKIADETDAHRPRATQHVEHMLRLIDRLLKSNHAYRGLDGAVYFDVQTFPEYGQLSGNTLDKLRTGAGGRVLDEHQSVKKHPADFLLWKPDPAHLMKWNPRQWGIALEEGYPGWHIECSAMAMHVLGALAPELLRSKSGVLLPGVGLPTIDIHTGGEDNIFPHHECEIAQSVCAVEHDHAAGHAPVHGQAQASQTFAKLWMHTRFLLVEGEKMSKRKGNFFTVRDVLQGKVTGRPVDPAVLRFELIRTHYRSNMNFTARGLSEDSAGWVQRLRDAYAKVPPSVSGLGNGGTTDGGMGVSPVDSLVLNDFLSALADDLNLSAALAVVAQWLSGNWANDPHAPVVLGAIEHLFAATQTQSLNDDITMLCQQIDTARQNKDFAAADRLRKQLQDAGYEVMTTKAGTSARPKLA